MFFLLFLAQVLVINGKTLWHLGNSDRLLTERHLLDKTYRNQRFHELNSPSLFSVTTQDVLELAEGTDISVEVLTRTGESIIKSCTLKTGILGLPDDKLSKVKKFSCSPERFEELQFIVNTEEENGMSATYFRGDGSAMYINAAYEEDNVYVMYEVSSFLKETTPPGFNHELIEADEMIQTSKRNLRHDRKLQISDTDVIELKVAILTSPEFAFGGGGSVSAISSNIQQMVSRTNGIYLRDVGIFWSLVDNFENGICLETSGAPCNTVGNFGGFATLNSVGEILEELGVPSDTYDAAQLFIFSLGAGGRATVGSICSAANKANAVSNGNDGNAGFDIDAFVVFMFAHELGHQVGAGHSFRDCSSQESQRSDSEAVEPGSGTTLMSLAGVCGGTTNLQFDRDSFFHSVSRQSIRETIQQKFEGIDNCGTRTALNLATSTLTTPNTCSVPIGNSFQLSGASSRSTSNRFYSWERVDASPESYTDEQLGRFRAYEAVQDRVDRFFPNLLYQNFVQDTDFELLPTVQRSMNFRFIERSNFDSSASQETLSTGVVSAHSTTETLVNFVNSEAFSLNEPSDGITINVDKGFQLEWNPGSLVGLSPDGRIKILFAENTMTDLGDSLSDIDYVTDVDDLDWTEIADVQVNSGGICAAIDSSIVNLNSLNQISGNILIKISTSQENGATVTDNSNCFVTALVTGVSLINEPEAESACVVGVVLAAPAGNSGLSSGGTATLVLFFLAMIAIIAVIVYKRRERTEYNFNDNVSLNSKKPRAKPLTSNQRWSNKRINLDTPQTDEETFRQKFKMYASTKVSQSKEAFVKVKSSIKKRTGSSNNKEEEDDDAISAIRNIVSIGVQRDRTKSRNRAVPNEIEEIPPKNKQLSSRNVFGAFKWQNRPSKSKQDLTKTTKVELKPTESEDQSRSSSAKTSFKSLKTDLFSKKFFSKGQTEDTITPIEDTSPPPVVERKKSKFGFTLPKFSKNEEKEGEVKSVSKKKEAERKALSNRYPFHNLKPTTKALKPKANKVVDKSPRDRASSESKQPRRKSKFGFTLPKFGKNEEDEKQDTVSKRHPFDNKILKPRANKSPKVVSESSTKESKFNFKIPKLNSINIDKNESKPTEKKYSFKIPKLNKVEKPNNGFQSKSSTKERKKGKQQESTPPPVRRNPTVAALRAKFERNSNESLSY